jgi:P4 family phage/plasmid primase-like protien
MSAVPLIPPRPGLEWLDHLYGQTDNGWLTLFAVDRTTGEKHLANRPVNQRTGIINEADRLAGTCCVWWGVATRKDRPANGRRGGASDCLELPGLYVDIDVKGPNHAAVDLPPTIDDAHTLLADYPLPPTAIVASGGGLQAWWLFDELQPVTDVAELLIRWGTTWAELGRRRGWHIDNVFDVARVMRLPGTWNRKNDPRPVEILTADWARQYAPTDLEEWTAEAPQRPAETTERRVPYIGPERPGDAFNASADPGALLEAAGCHFDHADANGDRHYRAPHRVGHTETTGATVYADGHTTIWSETFAREHGMVVRRPYDPFGLYAHLHHSGDFTKASDALEGEGYGTKASVSVASLIARHAPPPPAEDGDEPAGPVEFTYTDLGNARRLIAHHGDTLRYAPQIGMWLTWDGSRWSEDITGEAQRRAKETVDGMLTQIATGDMERDEAKALSTHWLKSQSAPRIEAMTALARTEPGVPILVTQLDADHWALNTTDGVIDLRTGRMVPHDRNALHTKLAAVHHDATATCPTWLWFLDWAMQGDQELVAFLKRAVGYSLTGTVSEQVLFFLHGAGENGKSTFLNVLQELLGEYGAAAESELLLATDHARHPTGLADLMGRRFVVAQELEDGRRLAEALVKQLTGGDVIKARRMRQDFFQFWPTHKLWMAANHKPGVRGTDHAIWRRIRLIPFLATVAPGQRDERLPDKLRAELPGILNWAIEGCLEWQRGGLQAPAAVIEATSSYRQEQDHVGRFLADCCELGDDRSVAAKDLRTAYETWCDENGERPWSAKAIGAQLTDRGCESMKLGRANTKTWVHVGLLDAEGPAYSRPIPNSDNRQQPPDEDAPW